jgi:uncharacterized repeat protein (TIGR03803 family)
MDEFDRYAHRWLVLIFGLLLSRGLHGQTLNTLWTFGKGEFGSQPANGVAIGPQGQLYGATLRGGASRNGVAFGLAPPSSPGGAWTPTILHQFGTVEGVPGAGLMIGPSGVLYGVTVGNDTDDFGTIFELKTPATGGAHWRETTLHAFSDTPADGIFPQGAPTFGPHDALYGTTSGGGAKNYGTVYRLAPPAAKGGAWTEEILWDFLGYPGDGQGPVGALAIGPDGAIFGVTEYGGLGGGTVFQLTPPASPGGSWVETLLYEFPPQAGFSGSAYPAGVILGPNHVLYGTTGQYDGKACDDGNPCGTVFEVTPPATPGGAWAETTLHTFVFGAGDGAQPMAPPLLDSDGAVYGTCISGGSTGYGTIFKMLPPSAPGGGWTEVILYSFTGGVDGQLPTGMAFGPDGNLYGTTSMVFERGGVGNYGTVFQFLFQ